MNSTPALAPFTSSTSAVGTSGAGPRAEAGSVAAKIAKVAGISVLSVTERVSAAREAVGSQQQDGRRLSRNRHQNYANLSHEEKDEQMQITVSDLDGSIKKVTLIGKLDIAGAGVIETPMAAVAGTRGNVLVDMTGVDFIASIGIR